MGETLRCALNAMTLYWDAYPYSERTSAPLPPTTLSNLPPRWSHPSSINASEKQKETYEHVLLRLILRNLIPAFKEIRDINIIANALQQCYDIVFELKYSDVGNSRKNFVMELNEIGIIPYLRHILDEHCDEPFYAKRLYKYAMLIIERMFYSGGEDIAVNLIGWGINYTISKRLHLLTTHPDKDSHAMLKQRHYILRVLVALSSWSDHERHFVIEDIPAQLVTLMYSSSPEEAELATNVIANLLASYSVDNVREMAAKFYRVGLGRALIYYLLTIDGEMAVTHGLEAMANYVYFELAPSELLGYGVLGILKRKIRECIGMDITSSPVFKAANCCLRLLTKQNPVTVNGLLTQQFFPLFETMLSIQSNNAAFTALYCIYQSLKLRVAWSVKDVVCLPEWYSPFSTKTPDERALEHAQYRQEQCPSRESLARSNIRAIFNEAVSQCRMTTIAALLFAKLDSSHPKLVLLSALSLRWLFEWQEDTIIAGKMDPRDRFINPITMRERLIVLRAFLHESMDTLHFHKYIKDAKEEGLNLLGEFDGFIQRTLKPDASVYLADDPFVAPFDPFEKPEPSPDTAVCEAAGVSAHPPVLSYPTPIREPISPRLRDDRDTYFEADTRDDTSSQPSADYEDYNEYGDDTFDD